MKTFGVLSAIAVACLLGACARPDSEYRPLPPIEASTAGTAPAINGTTDSPTCHGFLNARDHRCTGDVTLRNGAPGSANSSSQ
jgi:hypothetical protein